MRPGNGKMRARSDPGQRHVRAVPVGINASVVYAGRSRRRKAAISSVLKSPSVSGRAPDARCERALDIPAEKRRESTVSMQRRGDRGGPPLRL